MIKLLFSLYLFVFVSIVGINQASEYIWKNWVEHTPDEFSHAKQVAKTLQAHLADELQLQPQLRGLDIDSIAWLPEQRAELLNAEIITTYDEKGHALLSFLLKDKVTLVQLGPFLPAAPTSKKIYLYKFFSFLILCMLLVLWLRPLWLDLMQFKRVTEQLAEGDLNVEQKTSRFSAISDLTEQFHVMALKVASLMADQKELVSAVSHELRTPLARLKFALAMLHQTHHEQIAGMQDDVQEMEGLIEEMLGYARLEIAGENLELSPFNLTELVNEQISKLQAVSQKDFSVEVDEDITINANAHYIARVLQNLLQNADKYGKNKIAVSLHKHSEAIEFSVSDDGEGISEDKREAVFTPFVRVDKSRNKQLGGYGLGLAIVQKILHWHKSKCVIEDSHLGGAKFKVVFPD